MMGDALNNSRGESIHLTATWHAAAREALFDLIVDGQSQHPATVGPDGSQHWELDGRAAHWCLLTLREPGGRMLALTNPIYFDGNSGFGK